MHIPQNHIKNFALGLVTVGFILISIAGFLTWQLLKPVENRWKFESIDTMKYSRDLSREKLKDSTFDETIKLQTKLIAQTGATHIGIATPYDEEFLPILRRWVKEARANGLNVWFRGNFSGWEGWFDYPKITREEHLEKVRQFIANNGGLFVDGDVFSACPECENGGPGDPRTTGDVKGHRKFLIDEYEVSKAEFAKLGLNITSNYASMNYDVANLVMDKYTTKSLDGVVTIDHYVSTPERLNSDITKIAQKTGGKVVLGEFGAPIPDINGPLSEVEQAEWIDKALKVLDSNTHIIGANYWVNIGGSTQIWNADGTPRAAVNVITKFYKSISEK